jgi:hypothetical protein
MEDDREHWWAYAAVKAAVLAVVATCMVGTNTLGGYKSVFLGWFRVSDLEPWSPVEEPFMFFGWPVEYVSFVPPLIEDPSRGMLGPTSPCLFASETFEGLNSRLPIPPYNKPSINWLSVSFNALIAIGLLCYLAHVISVVDHRWRPICQFSLRFLLALPVLLAGIMALIHYDLLTWRRFFLAVVYAAVVVSLVCLVFDVYVFPGRRSSRS